MVPEAVAVIHRNRNQHLLRRGRLLVRETIFSFTCFDAANIVRSTLLATANLHAISSSSSLHCHHMITTYTDTNVHPHRAERYLIPLVVRHLNGSYPLITGWRSIKMYGG